jgi:carbon-monoxide dehydrogenase medium subunit
MLALRLARPSVVVDINRIPSLAGIAFTAEMLRIGAMTRQALILASADVERLAPLLIQTLRHVGHPPTRVRGTIGGSLCHADPAAELPVAMIALGATMVLRNPSGERRVAARSFFRSAFETAVAPAEMLVAVEIPRQTARSGFNEVSPRHGDFAIASAAVTVDLDGDGMCRSCAIVAGGIGERPVECVDAAASLMGGHLDATAIGGIAKALPYDAITMDSRLASAAYRHKILPVVVKRALADALGSAEAVAR